MSLKEELRQSVEQAICCIEERDRLRTALELITQIDTIEGEKGHQAVIFAKDALAGKDRDE